MGDRMGLARKLEPVDFSISDPADGQILDDYAVQGILEPNDNFDLTVTFTPHGGLHNRLMLREALRRLERDTEGTTSQHSNQTKAARVSWGQRLLNRFRAD